MYSFNTPIMVMHYWTLVAIYLFLGGLWLLLFFFSFWLSRVHLGLTECIHG